MLLLIPDPDICRVIPLLDTDALLPYMLLFLIIVLLLFLNIMLSSLLVLVIVMFSNIDCPVVCMNTVLLYPLKLKFLYVRFLYPVELIAGLLPLP